MNACQADENGETALMYAADKLHVDRADELLRQPGIDVNKVNDNAEHNSGFDKKAIHYALAKASGRANGEWGITAEDSCKALLICAMILSHPSCDEHIAKCEADVNILVEGGAHGEDRFAKGRLFEMLSTAKPVAVKGRGPVVNEKWFAEVTAEREARERAAAPRLVDRYAYNDSLDGPLRQGRRY